MFDTLHSELELIERALGTLLLVSEHGPIGIRRLSRITEREHHEIRAALKLLEEEGYVESTPDGATKTPEAQTFLAGLDDDIDDMTARIDALPSRSTVPTRAER